MDPCQFLGKNEEEPHVLQAILYRVIFLYKYVEHIQIFFVGRNTVNHHLTQVDSRIEVPCHQNSNNSYHLKNKIRDCYKINIMYLV